MNNEEKVIIAGFGGQGVMLMGQILSHVATLAELNTTWIPSYGPETRGGTANCAVTIAKERINSPVVSVPDSLIIMNQPSLEKFQKKLKKGGVLIANKSQIEGATYRDDIRVHEIDANRIALEIGNLRVANMVMLGAYIAASGVFEKAEMFAVFERIFTGKKSELIESNKQALEAGIKAVKE